MTVLSLPALRRKNASQFQLSLVTNTQTFQSPLNKSVQTYELPGARWQLTATFENLGELDARMLKAWIAKLRGAAGRFYCSDLSHKRPNGKAIGAGTVYGAGQAGTSIISAWMIPLATADSTILTADIDTFSIDASAGNVPLWLLPGDYCNINGELKIITDIVPLDNQGHATLSFAPPLRAIPADGSPIIISAPTAVFRLNDDQQDKFNFNPDRHPTVTITAQEVF